MQPQRRGRIVTAGGGDADLDLRVHLATVEIAKPCLDFDAPIARLEARFQSDPVDGDGTDVLEPNRSPHADRPLPAVWLGEPRVRRRRIRPALAGVEGGDDGTFLVGLRLSRRSAP